MDPRRDWGACAYLVSFFPRALYVPLICSFKSSFISGEKKCPMFLPLHPISILFLISGRPVTLCSGVFVLCPLIRLSSRPLLPSLGWDVRLPSPHCFSVMFLTAAISLFPSLWHLDSQLVSLFLPTPFLFHSILS